MTTTTTPTTDAKPNIGEMRVIHRVFRRELALLPGLVRTVPEGDTVRSVVVGDHTRLVLAGLHMHHAGEDVVLWPLLLERAAPSTGLIETMQAQHERVVGLVARVESPLTEWTESASAASREELAFAIEELATGLFEHLDLEEQEVLPLISRYITVAEWNSLGEHGRESMTSKQLPLMFGSILEDADDEERAMMLAALPFPVRLVMRAIGGRQYRRYITRVRGA